MPVSVLLVEGELDEQVLFAFKPPGLTLERGGPKGSLKPAARDRRKKTPATCYLRDRDFDFDPPTALAVPTIDAEAGNGNPQVLGWRWCRHEMENYLLEPRLVEQATSWPEAEYTRALLAAASHLQHYTAARWTVGVARRSLPPFRDLPTRPDNLTNEIKIPSDCSEALCDSWVHTQTASFLSQIGAVLNREAIATTLTERKQRLASLSQPQDVLLWHAGKDLAATLAPSLPGPFRGHPLVFLRALRDWVRDNPDPALALFPEWRALVDALTAA